MNVPCLEPRIHSSALYSRARTTQRAGHAEPSENPLGEARELYRKGNFEGALARYRSILEKSPASPDAHAGIVRVLLKQKNVEAAAEAAQQALKLSDSPRIHVAWGEVLFRQGRIPEAEMEWVKVVNSGYPDARAFLGLARVRRAVAMYKSSQQMVEKAHNLDPNDPDVQDAWVLTLSRAERIKYLESMLAAANHWDGDEREGVGVYLNYLRERGKQPARRCRLVSKIDKTETPLVRLLLDPTHLRGYGLTVSLNGHKSNLMLDTGASGILVKRAVAERAGINKLTETKVWGIGDKGKRNAFVGIADSIRVGELEFQNCPIEVMESRSVANEDGLIGADVFEDFLIDIDFPNEKLKLSELPKRPGEQAREVGLEEDDDPGGSDSAAPADAAAKNGGKETPRPGPQDRYIAPEMQSYTRVYRFGHQLLVTTKIGDVPNKLFVLDIGAWNNMISPAAAREVTKVHNDDAIIKGISGSVKKVYSADKAVLQFGRLRQENQDMASFDFTNISDSSGTEISGFLGFAMLRMLDVKIDYRDALVDFTFAGNKH